MTRNHSPRVVQMATFILSLSLLIAGHVFPGAVSASFGEGAGFMAFWNLSGPDHQAPENTPKPAEKPNYVADLEKKIAGQENKPAEEVFKNIQLFKGMPAGRVLRVMSVAFSPALGVDCTHCHIPDQWEKDDKEPKQIARKMWAFSTNVNKELKEAIGKGVVNCTTCHRGQVKPALNLPPPTK